MSASDGQLKVRPQLFPAAGSVASMLLYAGGPEPLNGGTLGVTEFQDTWSQVERQLERSHGRVAAVAVLADTIGLA